MFRICLKYEIYEIYVLDCECSPPTFAGAQLNTSVLFEAMKHEDENYKIESFHMSQIFLFLILFKITSTQSCRVNFIVILSISLAHSR